jgi:poly(A) polymerase
LSRERLRMEMLKLVVAKHATPTLIVMSDAGFTSSILAGVIYLSAFENMTKVEVAAGLAADATRRLGALAVAVPEDAERLYQRLRLANHERDRMRTMAEGWHGLSPRLSERETRALIYRRGASAFSDQALLAWARSPATSHDTAWHAFVARAERLKPPVFPLRADDFIKRGIAKGPALGAALRAAEEAWISADFPLDRAALAAIADQAATR